MNREQVWWRVRQVRQQVRCQVWPRVCRQIYQQVCWQVQQQARKDTR
jgi:hypothetical protein